MPRDGSLPLSYGPSSTRRRWIAVSELAGRQYGVVALWQLREFGIPDATVRGWVAARRLVRLHRGVYAVGHAALRPEGRYLAGVLACGRGAVLSHRSAAALWDIRASAGTRIDVTAPRRTGRKQGALRVHRADRLGDDERTTKDGIPCTTVARILLDLAAVLHPRGVEAVVETSERLGLFDLRQVGALLGRHAGRRGVGRLRRAIAVFDEELVRVRTETEARFYRLCLDSGLPKPRVNRQLEAGRDRFEVDFHWPHARLIVEVDSPFHDTRAAKRRDAKRDAAFVADGWTVIRCRWADIVDDPVELVATLRRHLISAAGAFR